MKVTNGWVAMTRLEEAGALPEELLGEKKTPQEIIFRCMDLQMEVANIGNQMIAKDFMCGIEAIAWIIPLQKQIFAEVRRRHLEKHRDAKFALKKIQSVLLWILGWFSKRCEEVDHLSRAKEKRLRELIGEELPS